MLQIYYMRGQGGRAKSNEVKLITKAKTKKIKANLKKSKKGKIKRNKSTTQYDAPVVAQDVLPIENLVSSSPLPFLVVRQFPKLLRVIYANRSALSFLGFPTLEEILGMSLDDIIDPTGWLPEEVKPGLTDNKLVTTLIRDPYTGNSVNKVTTLTYSSYAKIENLEHYSLIFLPPGLGKERDPLTKLKTRTEFYRDLSNLIESLKRKKKAAELSLIFIDLDNFKSVNDVLGHRKGDEVLTEIVKIIQTSIKKTDRVYRYGGDEFVIVVPTIKEIAIRVAERILRQFHSKRDIFPKKKNIHKKLGLSIGISTWYKGLDPIHLIDRADLAMYSAKNSGGMRIAVYNEKENRIDVLHSNLPCSHGLFKRILMRLGIR